MRSRSLLLCCLWPVAACVTSGAGGAANVPSLALQDVDGRTQYLSDHIGQKVVVMSFWATWCQPCRQELLVLQEIYDKQRERGLEVLAISIDGPETQASVRAFVKQYGFTFPVLLDSDTRCAALYNPRKLAPMLHIFDRTGRVVFSQSTFQPGETAALRARILKVLAGDQRDEEKGKGTDDEEKGENKKTRQGDEEGGSEE
jgi:peroxiredoxin